MNWNLIKKRKLLLKKVLEDEKGFEEFVETSIKGSRNREKARAIAKNLKTENKFKAYFRANLLNKNL